MNKKLYLLVVSLLFWLAVANGEVTQTSTSNMKADGYKGIWFTLNQFSEYGDKYSGGLGTYTSSHSPLAIYVPEADTTFFCYGGTRGASERHLLIMVGSYNHATGKVARPTIVYDLQGVDDPHDNPSLAIDETGHLWVFVSGRNVSRPGRIFRATEPYSIEQFEAVNVSTFTYPQPHWIEGQGFLHLFTKYTGVRELYWSVSENGVDWASDQKLAGIGGHYQVSARQGDRVITAFNRHPGGNPDKRTDLYFLQTSDQGASWQTAAGRTIDPPLSEILNPALVKDYASDGRLVYIHDITFDRSGHPLILYTTSSHHQPGPQGGPRLWEIAHWNGSEWIFRVVADSTHNYDVGFLKVEPDGVWRVYGPTEAGPQMWGTGGEVALWESDDAGASWTQARKLTRNSPRNHSYVRHPVNAHPEFYAFWADGHADTPSRSYLYFANREGDVVRRLPYTMDSETAEPEVVAYIEDTSPASRHLPSE
jgi:hypothetical protein